MSNPSRIAMLAQLHSDLMDDTHAADVHIGALKAAGGARSVGVAYAETAMDQSCKDASEVTTLMLSQRPIDLQDVLSLMIAMASTADSIQDYASIETPDADRIVSLAERIELAAGNVAAFLHRTAETRNSSDFSVAQIFGKRFDPATVANRKEA